jgi:MFS transporter, putative metabolite:H+ symporter
VAVLVAALGYFVDIYDLLLFGIVREQSLRSLGLTPAEILREGLFILDAQMAGMLLGGIFWGVLGDRRGRLSVLFGSIVLYSLANIANGFVQSVGAYALIRFIAGVGLAGELGAGITLVSEVMKRETRGYGTSIVAAVGICGAIAAVFVAKVVSWRTAYFIGGGLGLALLLLRVGVLESGLFQAARHEEVRRGNFLSLFTSWSRARRYLAVIAVGIPIWYVVGILILLAPELGRTLGMSPAPSAGNAVLASYAGLALGDIGSGVLSQLLRSRRKILLGFLVATVLLVIAYFTLGAGSLVTFYAICFGLGVTTGYWAVFVTVASEQFGTNLRATVTTTAPNFVRGAVVPMTALFRVLGERFALTTSALVVGAVAIALALVGLSALEETYGRDLDFLERES